MAPHAPAPPAQGALPKGAEDAKVAPHAERSARCPPKRSGRTRGTAASSPPLRPDRAVPHRTPSSLAISSRPVPSERGRARVAKRNGCGVGGGWQCRGRSGKGGDAGQVEELAPSGWMAHA
ncbi:hypothetical protein C2845_PM01G23810 [Panicum miliaceum]|uniref:Uncharacterized protein n=1 Tax=Panicum miliaceum TaxID=4540 RepID=A0A3L6THC9_PANMI|nr:hypothetical protein C2845_PM01G23810 [Panicum miliaceum]